MASELRIGRLMWFEMVGELRRRGRGDRESGAFLLARHDSRRVAHVAYYDDLDPHCLNGGYIHFDGTGYVVLSQLCQSRSLRVVADVHTHPSSWTDQSATDQAHPMMSRAGHIGLIIPHFAQGNRLGLRGVGAFSYLGEGSWAEQPPRVRLTWL